MRSLLVSLLAGLGLAADAVANDAWQPVQLPHTVQHETHSQSTGRDYRLYVAEPSQAPPPGGYPVLYVLDGNALFPGLAIQAQALEDRPEPSLRDSVLVVGIGYPGEALYQFKARAEDYTPDAEDRQRPPGREPPPSGGADDFLAFIETELKPLIARRYPVNAQAQTLFGHSYGGLFTLHTLLSRPQAFQGYVAASPSIWWYKGYIERTLAGFERQAADLDLGAQLLVTAGSAEEPAPDDPLTDPRQRHMAERRMVGNARDLARRLDAIAGLDVRFVLNPDANHGTNSFHSAIEALELAARIGRSARPERGD